MLNEDHYPRRIFLKAASGITLSVGVAGCVQDATSTEDEEGPAEPESLPDGLTEDGPDLEVLRSAVGDIIQTNSFIGHGESAPHSDRNSRARTIGGNPTPDRGIELNANDEEAMHSVVNQDNIELENAAAENLVGTFSWFYNYYEDQTNYRTGEGVEPEMTGETTYQEFVEETSSRYADQVFEALSILEFDTPEWEPDLGLYTLPASYDGDEVTIHYGELWVTADGLPIFVGGIYTEAGERITAFVMLQQDDVAIEPPNWLDEIDEN